MEIRNLARHEREALQLLLAGWQLSEGWTAGDRLARTFQVEPDFDERNVFVAAARGELLACVQIFPRRLRVLGHEIPTGGLGNLYTREDQRAAGLASQLLDHALVAMRERGLELSLILAAGGSRAFLEKRDWRVWKGQRTVLRREEQPRVTTPGDESVELVPLDPGQDRALGSVKAIHAAYAASRSGTVVRDDALWSASLAGTVAPNEELWIARRGGLAVAYARAALVDDVLTLTELGRFEDGAGALARLIEKLLEPREADPLAVGVANSKDLRSFVVLPTFDDIGLTVALEHRGISSHPMDDDTAMVRCVNLIALASRLDVDLLPEEAGHDFLSRILPPDGMVFWPADRF